MTGDFILKVLGAILVLFIIVIFLLVKFGGASITIKNDVTKKTTKWGKDDEK